MKISDNKSISDSLHKYDYLTKENSNDDYVEITRWQNGEGFTAMLGDHIIISLTDGQLDALVHLNNQLRYND